MKKIWFLWAALGVVAVLCGFFSLSVKGEKDVEVKNKNVAELFADTKFLEKFAEEYNAVAKEEDRQFYGKEVEFSCPVTVYPEGHEGVYIDFDGENGYMVINDENEVVSFEVAGDYPVYRNDESIAKGLSYSIYDGFVYLDENGETIRAEGVSFTEELWEKYSGGKGSETAKSKAGGGGRGEIFLPDEYVREKYGTGYSLYQKNHLTGYDYAEQNDFSIYNKKIGGNTYGEGNCVLSSVYSLMNYLRQCGKYPLLPRSYETVYFRAAEDKFYTKYKGRTDYSIVKTKNLPKLYYNVRAVAVNDYGYETGGVNPFVIDKLTEKTGRKFNSKPDATHLVLWSFESAIKKEVDAGYPIIWNMANSAVYGSHTTVVTGYRVYRRQKKILGIRISEYVKLAELNDNWNDCAVYFDMGDYKGVGSFVRVR